jgi:sugar O-acyltransferase (sialic acid O-acetyltransferase NeuD family)
MKAVILGAGGGGRLYLDTLRDSTEAERVEVIGFIDDNPELLGKEFLGVQVLGMYSQLSELIATHDIKGILVAYSDRFMRLRKERYKQCVEQGLKPVNVIHPSAVISSSVSIGEGAFIGKGVLIDVGTELGQNCSIHRGASVGEYCVLEENVWVAGGVNLAGNVTVGENTMIGTGANLIPRCRIGKDVIVGAGTVVINDVPDGVTVAGVPARIIKERMD